MDLAKVLEQLRRELDHLNAAIVSLERLQATEVRRGRPPGSLVELRRLKAAEGNPAPQPRRAQRREGDS
jgi:hypothetical protein